MKITFVLPYAGLAGGIRVVAIYADRLKKRGHDVAVVSLRLRPLSLRQKFKKLFLERKWPTDMQGLSHFDGLDINHRILNHYGPVTDDDVPEADVVIATWWETAEWVNALSNTKGRKFYFIQHHEVHDGLPVDRVKATYLLPLCKIVVSQWLIDILAKEYGASNVFLVPNSVDCEFLNSTDRGRQTVPTVGFMYSGVFFKGCDTIIEAINLVRKDVSDLRTISFGVEPPSRQLPLPDSTQFFCQPSQHKICEIYSSCDFWIFGSRAEGFGLPILEAMACRTPVIATKAGVAPEMVSQGGGFLVEEYSSSALAQTILRCLKISEDQWKQCSEKARATVMQYNWDDATYLFEKAIAPKQVVPSSASDYRVQIEQREIF